MQERLRNLEIGVAVMDLTSISVALKSIQHATNLVKNLRNVSKDIETQEIKLELQEVITSLLSELNDAQLGYSQLIAHTQKLQQKLDEIDEWKIIQKRYELVETSPGHFAYALKAGSKNPKQPKHFICANCYENKTRSILNKNFVSEHGADYECHKCELRITDESEKEYRNYDDDAQHWAI